MVSTNYSNFQQPMTEFISVVKSLCVLRAKNETDIADHLLKSIQIMLSSLGKQIGSLKESQLQTLHETFSIIEPTLQLFAKDGTIWHEHQYGQVKLIQIIATINNVTSNCAIPPEALKHPAFHGNALKQGFIERQKNGHFPLEFPTPQEFAIAYASECLNLCKKDRLPRRTACYLLRPSSSVSSEQIKVVTLSFNIDNGPVSHARLHYNPSMPHKSWRSDLISANTLNKLITKILRNYGALHRQGVPPFPKTKSKITIAYYRNSE